MSKGARDRRPVVRGQRSEVSNQRTEVSSQITEEIIQIESAMDLDVYKLANEFAMAIFEITKRFHRKKDARCRVRFGARRDPSV